MSSITIISNFDLLTLTSVIFVTIYLFLSQNSEMQLNDWRYSKLSNNQYFINKFVSRK